MNNIKESRKSTKFKKTLFGMKGNVFTFAIATSENPMAQKVSDAENAELRKELEEWLKANKISFYPLKGKYINEENSYLIPNINLRQCMYLFGKEKFNQESFIFAKVDDYSNIHYFYYQQNEDGEFELLDESDESKNQEEANDFYSKYFDYKFNIPFSIFEKSLRDYSEALDEKMCWNADYKNKLKSLVLSENKSLSSLWRNMNILLVTEKQDKDRRYRIKNFI